MALLPSLMSSLVAERLPPLRKAARPYDAVIIQREAMLVGPPWLEHVFARANIPIIYDIDDAVWLYNEPIAGSFRARYPRIGNFVRAPQKGNELLALAREVVTGSDRLAAHARSLNASVTTIPTVVDLTKWMPVPRSRPGAFHGDVPILGWIGTPSTAPYLAMVEPALVRLRAEGFKFRVVTRGVGPGYTWKNLEAEDLPWRQAEEPLDFASFDIGLAPMQQDAWSNGKCAFKQIQYMSVGVPCVTSRAGAVDEFVVHGENALVAEHEDEFYGHLKQLLQEEALRARLADAGLRTMQKKYSLAAQIPNYIRVVQRAAGVAERNT